MRTFAELLTEFTERTGISDAELARALNVSRQTIFRWKEGLVEKPRYREDVLRIADKLRLTPVERDELLLAAGFPPQTPVVTAPETLPTVPPAPPVELVETFTLRAPESKRSPAISRPAIALVAALVVIVVGALIFVAMTGPRANLPSAAPGETLIIIAQFADSNKTPAPTAIRRFAEADPAAAPDASSRLQAALEREVRAARLENLRVVILPETIRDAARAEQIRQQTQAAIVVWGTPSAEHLTVGLTVAPAASRADDLALDALVTPPCDAPLKIASASPDEIQLLALVVLAHLQLADGNLGMARAALTQALSRPAQEQTTQAILNLHAGYVAQIAKPPELGAAIQFYSQTITLAPDLPTAYLNHGIASIRLNDAPQWQSDFTRVLTLSPDHSGAQLALCWAHALDKQPQLALPHCDAAVSRDATARSREARTLVYTQLGRLPDAAKDLQAFLDWLARQPESLRARYGSTRADWLQSLKAGKNPIDDAILEKLRRE
jgi:transcriptional regulator with XRE-family HTH domain/regulator of sirC expression with transglutaminase-like and TPR domain